MLLSSSLLALLGLSCTASALSPAEKAFAKAQRPKPVIEKRVPHQEFKDQRLRKRAHNYLNNATEKFVVNGSAIPDVDFDVGESYAGLLPISGDADETRELFFWFFPTTNSDPQEEITIWFNGGPGCSSLSGLLTENGPFTWEAGTLAPVQNPYTWVNLTNMMWVEQPIGVGFTQGTPNITNEYELGKQFVGFYKQFVEAFGVQGWDLYLTGESYGGYYVPYIADAFITADDPDMPLKGININDPILGDDTTQQEVVIAPYLEYWQNMLYLNESFMERLWERNDECGYTDYFNKYLTYPPPQMKFPVLPAQTEANNYSCDQFSNAYAAILEVNPCFNIYHITETCPHPYSVLGEVNEGDYTPPGSQVYFNRTDVQKAINAPPTDWNQCVNGVFRNPATNKTVSDQSIGPAQNDVLKRVIEYTNNTLIGSGNLDMLLSTNGTLLALQNVTVSLHLPPSTPLETKQLTSLPVARPPRSPILPRHPLLHPQPSRVQRRRPRRLRLPGTLGRRARPDVLPSPARRPRTARLRSWRRVPHRRAHVGSYQVA
jgi:carboxypeptidase D